MKERIAIIGGGVSGLMAGYLLHEKYDVTLYEKTGRIGGNAYTYLSRSGEEVDIAVAAFGLSGYKHFYRLLSRLGVSTKMCAGSLMSFHDLDKNDGIYMTPSPRGLMAQRFRLLHPAQVRAFYNVFRGLEEGRKMARSGAFEGETVEEALAQSKYLEGDAKTILMCVFCLLSSMSAGEIRRAPASFFFNKLNVHNDVVSWKAIYSVRAVDGKTKRYIDALSAAYRDRIILNARLKSVARDQKQVAVAFEDGTQRVFDHVVFACNADQALSLLESPTPAEKELLGAWRYKEGKVVVHRDNAAFPKPELMQAYTFLYTNRGGVMETSVNGSLKHEPGVSRSCDLISSQHPNFPVRENLIELDTVLRTPVFDFNSCATIKRLPELNGVMKTYYCGSHFGFGLHEDAVRSAVDAARKLGVEFWN